MIGNSKNPTARREDLVVQESADDVLVYDLKTDKACCLNKTAALVWKYCDGTRNAETIARLVGSEVKSQVPVELVWLAFEQLEKEDLLKDKFTPQLETASTQNGISRRDVMKRVALTSLVALPLVSVLMFPQSTSANTCVQGQNGCTGGIGGCSCSSGFRCCCPSSTSSCTCVSASAFATSDCDGAPIPPSDDAASDDR